MESAVEPLNRPNGEPFSATDMRKLLGDILANKDALQDFAGDNVDGVLAILGVQTLEETTVAAAVVGGIGVPNKRKSKKKKKQQENIDISLVDDVIRLIMERGISQ